MNTVAQLQEDIADINHHKVVLLGQNGVGKFEFIV